ASVHLFARAHEAPCVAAGQPRRSRPGIEAWLGAQNRQCWRTVGVAATETPASRERRVIDLMPRHQFGYINPVQISDYIHLQFYRIFPADCLLVNCPLNLQSFSTGGVDRALEAFWGAFDFLVDRKVERISQGGIPVSAYAGRPRILGMLE